ncbi:MAG: GGDEF domain-containing protein, partial [Thermoleophilaceae bacterium]
MRDGIDSFVLVADLDGFKGFNDRYGHSAGDEALRQFAGALGLAARGTDILGRLGGDEFGILLVRCQETAVRGFTTRVREAMAIVADSRLGKLDVSLGHASLPGSTSAAKGGFENPWHITAPLQEPGKQLLVFACQGNVMSVLVERAQVHMAQAV